MGDRRSARRPIRPAADPAVHSDAAQKEVTVRYEFETARPPKLRFGLAAGRIEIETADVEQTIVEVEAIRGDVEELKVEQHGRDIVIEGRKRFGLKSDSEFDIRVRSPHGSDVDGNVASAQFRTAGRLGALEVNTASGDIQVEQVDREVKIHSASGDVQLAAVGGRADVNTASGDVQIESVVGGGTIRSASGDVQIGDVGGRVKIQTASGDMVIGSIAEGEVDIKSASGDARVGIKQGSRLHVDARSLSGETTSEVELGGVEVAAAGPLVEVKGTTMSGDIKIVRA
jgi:DUF4097 and DUF4098 domain-containing protein YvlB